MNTLTWDTNSGHKATVTISIDKHVKYADTGWGSKIEKESTASDWTIKYSAKVEGHGEANGLNTSITDEKLPAGYAGRLGKLCFDAEKRAQIEAMIAEVKASADWQKHLESEAAADKAEQEYYEAAAKIKKAMEM